MKKFLVFLMVFLMVCTVLSANGKSEDVSESGVSKEAFEDGPMVPYPEPVTVTLVRGYDDNLENNVLSKLEDETIDDNRWTRLVKDRLNIDIEYLWIAKGADQFNQKFNVSLATGDIPDIVNVNAAQLKQLAEADLIQDLQPVLDKYTTTMSRLVIDEGGPIPLEAATIDGKLLGIPFLDANHESANFLWMRQDWLEQYGLEQPKSMDDMIHAIETFMTKGPDGMVGMAVAKDLWGGYASLNGFFNAYHAYPNTWIEKDGKLAFGSIQPEMKTALTRLAQMYKDGLIEKEFAVKDGGKVSEAASAGLNGAFYGMQWNALWPLGTSRQNDPTAEWRAYPIVSADNEQALTQIKLGTSSWYSVRADYEHPEALMKLYNLYCEKAYEGDPEDFATYMYPDGMDGMWKLSPVITFRALLNLNTWRNIQGPLKTGDPGKLFGEELKMYEYCSAFLEGSEENWGWYRTFGHDGSWSVMDAYETQNLYYMDRFISAPTPTMVEKKATLDKMQNELILKIIMGQESVDAFDEFVADWLALGGQDMTDEVNQ